MKHGNIIIFVALMFFSESAAACFSGYFAPSFLDFGDAVIGSGLLLIIFAVIVNLLAKRKFNLTLLIVPLIFLGISYFGHWTYVGDCGERIVFLNTVATLLAGIWMALESLKLYLSKRRKNT